MKPHDEFHSRAFKYEKSDAETLHTLLLSCHTYLRDKHGYEKRGTVCFEQVRNTNIQRLIQVFNRLKAHSSFPRKAFVGPALCNDDHYSSFCEHCWHLFLKRNLYTHELAMFDMPHWQGTRVVECTTQRHKWGVLADANQECWVFIPTAILHNSIKNIDPVA